MLVMTTIFISKMEGLPPTSDIKMIDIWLILCQLVPFVQVVLLTAIEYLREEKELDSEVEKKSESVSVKQDKQVEKEELGAEDKPKPSEAWVPMNTEPVQTDIMKNILTIGGSILRFLLKLFNHPYIAERKAMPLAVVAAFVISFCTAMGFYFG